MKQFSFRISPQQRLVPSLDKFLLPIVLPGSAMILEIEEFSVLKFCEQAEQDINTAIRIGGQKIVWQSGLFTTTGADNISEQPKHTTETRAIAQVGIPYNVITSQANSGIPDNFSVNFIGLKFLVSGGEIVYFEIRNQSAIYSHAVRVSLGGILYMENKK